MFPHTVFILEREKINMKTNTLPLIFIVFILTSGTVFSSWKPVALGERNINALVYKSNALFVGTENAGVYRYEKDTASRIGDNSLSSSNVLCIEVFKKGDIIVAGTNNGLFVYSKNPNNLWVKNDQLGSSAVRALLRYQDSLFFAVTNKTVYVASVKSDSLAADLDFKGIDVSGALPSVTRDLELRCITMFRDTLFLGSVYSGSNSSWGGILRSIDNGKTWGVFNSGWENMNSPSIKSLAVYTNKFSAKAPTYLATAIVDINSGESAVFRRTGSEATWERVVDLDNRQVNQVYITFYSNSLIALEHVASDSGVYKNSNNTWNKIGNLTSCKSVMSNDDGSTGVGYSKLYAGTANGLYENSEVVLVKKKSKKPVETSNKISVHSTSLSLKKVEGSAAGVRIISDRDNKNPVSLLGKSCRKEVKGQTNQASISDANSSD